MILPIGVSLQNFAGSLVVDYPNDNIPILHKDKDWRTFGSFVAQETTFGNNGAPGPGRFSNPSEWTQALFKAMEST